MSRNELAEKRLRTRLKPLEDQQVTDTVVDFYFSTISIAAEKREFLKWVLTEGFDPSGNIEHQWQDYYISGTRYYRSILNHLPDGTTIRDTTFKESEAILDDLKTDKLEVERFKKWLKKLECFDNLPEAWDKYQKLTANKSLHISAFMYNPECVAIRYNISLEDAIIKVQNAKKSKTTNLEGFIARHGEEEGRKKFEQFQNTSKSYTEKVKQGLEDKNSPYYQSDYFRRKSKWCAEYYTSRGISDDPEEIRKMISEFQINNAGVSRNYYLSRGFTEAQTERILADIATRKGRGIFKLVELYGENEGIKRHISKVEKYRATQGSDSIFIDFHSYKMEVNLYTKISLELYGDKIENLELRGREQGYNLDHVYSVKDGYDNEIDPALIAHWSNLRCIPAEENLSKGTNSAKSLEDLFEDFYKAEFDESNED